MNKKIADIIQESINVKSEILKNEKLITILAECSSEIVKAFQNEGQQQ